MLRNVSRETRGRLELYVQLILKWGRSINLLSENELSFDHIWNRHVLDSLQIFRYVVPQEATVCDVGAGAGFPGMVLAILGLPSVTLIENNHKRASFLRSVSRETGTSVRVLEQDVYAISEKFDVMISRAFADLNELCAIAEKLLTPRGYGVYLKGKTASEEIQGAQNRWAFDLELIPSLTSDEGNILKVTRLRKREGM